MKKHRTLTRRLIAALLSLALLLSATTVAVSAQPAPAAAAAETTADAPGIDYASRGLGALAWLWNGFWNNFQLLSFMLSPTMQYFFNSRLSFQWIFGYNMVYNFFAPVVGALIDTQRTTFVYGDREWKIMLWKGAYLWGLGTGAEIGIYSRPLTRSIAQFDSARIPDWIGMGFSVYHYDHLVVTRPVETRWWQTAYALYIATDILASPRANITMVSHLRFNTATKAQAYADALEARGFARYDGIITRETCDSFGINGVYVDVSWRLLVE